jgi:hypothetical protein
MSEDADQTGTPLSDREVAMLVEPMPKPAAQHSVGEGLKWIPSGPVARSFVFSSALTSGIMGPWGSGKTTAGFVKGLVCSIAVPPSPVDGVRYARTGVIRDTYRNLELNTLSSWFENFPRDLGEWRGGGSGEPGRARIRWALQDGTELDWEVIFVAVGDHNVRQFCDGLQLTNCFVNAGDSVPEELFTIFMTPRLSRYPSREQRPENWGDEVDKYAKLFTDYNAPDEDNHLYKNFIEKPIPGWKNFVQPGGLDPGAENLPNLRPGYYANLMKKNADPWWINRFVHNKPGYSRSGEPVYPEFNDDLHTAPIDVQYDPTRDLIVGVDGGRDACAVFAQRRLMGGFDVLAECIPEHRCSADKFGEKFSQFVADEFPNLRNMRIYADPATDNPNDMVDKVVWLDAFLDAAELDRTYCGEVPTNDFGPRRMGVAQLLNELDSGRPMFRLSPRCKVLRKGFMSKYCFEILENRQGDKRSPLSPVDNPWTHPHDALQYAVIGSGDFKHLRSRRAKERSRRGGEVEQYDPLRDF